MRACGLTGGIGMGKSAAAGFLADRGIPVVDTDLIAREVVEPGQPCLQEVVEAFGEGVVTPGGRLDRERLAAIVFSDATARGRLEAILHPRIRAVWKARLMGWEEAGHPVGVVIIPLLFETGAQTDFDWTVCIACSPLTQRQRLRGRGWSEAEMDSRIAAQLPVERKMELADYVVWNEGCLDLLGAQLERIFA